MAGADEVRRILAQRVFAAGASIAFGELTLADVRGRAQELRSVTGWGPTARVAPVALAWRELALALERRGAATVGDLDRATLEALAPRLWITPPAGGLL